MPLPTTLGSYGPELDIFDQALADAKGVRICFATVAQARQARFRMHQARALDRQEKSRVYPKDNPLHGKSEYDCLVCRLVDDAAGEWWIYVERHGRNMLAVEPLSEVEG